MPVSRHHCKNQGDSYERKLVKKKKKSTCALGAFILSEETVNKQLSKMCHGSYMVSNRFKKNGCYFKKVLGVGVLTEVISEQRPEEVVNI